MRKPLRIFILVFMFLLLVLQFFRPGFETEPATQDDLLISLDAGDEIIGILRASCYDCHSNETSYPWYSKVSPISWYLNKHIREGKEELNFSTFASSGRIEQLGALTGICEVLDEGSMPLKSYLLLHRESELSEDEAKMLCDWAEVEAEKILKN